MAYGIVATTCFSRGVSSAAGYAPTVTCPSGSTLILKNMRFDAGGAGTGNVVAQLFTSTMARGLYVLDQAVAVGQPLDVNCWIALVGGDSLFIYLPFADVGWWISGSQLSGDAPWTPAPGLTLQQPFMPDPEQLPKRRETL